MAVTIYPALVRLFLLTWQHHHPMIVSIIVSIIQWGMSGKDQRLDASLLQCTLSSSRLIVTDRQTSPSPTSERQKNIQKSTRATAARASTDPISNRSSSTASFLTALLGRRREKSCGEGSDMAGSLSQAGAQPVSQPPTPGSCRCR